MCTAILLKTVNRVNNSLKRRSFALSGMREEMVLHGSVKIAIIATRLTAIYAEVSQLLIVDCQM